MSTTPADLIDALAKLRGLGEAYYDHRGELHYFSKESRCAILQAMGLILDDETALRTALESPALSAAVPIENAAAPRRCYEPLAADARKYWGLSIQLYTLRSSRNWGIGDFRDLCELIELAAPLGCDVIGLNPLHALFLADPAHCSPYSPSSRLFLNALYVAVDALPEFASCPAAQALYSQSAFQTALAGLRTVDNVMYAPVATLKLSMLRLLYAYFQETRAADAPRRQAFRDFVAARGEALRLYALFTVLDAHFRERGFQGWRQWPVEYRNPRSPSVLAFAGDRAEEIEFHMFVQWLAEEQLAAAQRLAIERGMRIGLYGDLAVGANPDGSDVWSNPSLYVLDAAVGAPPDPLALGGQDWGIPPIDPHALRLQNFHPFIDLLHANMRPVGALRIDHVMSLFRLWWVPRGCGAIEGVYVHYPLDELLQQLARESNAAHCLVIGEDLGTVPDEMRHAMADYRLYSYKVLLFEKFFGRFKAPHEYPRQAVATATTHDLPSLKAWWQHDDIVLRDRLKLYPSMDTAQRLHAERTGDRYALMRALRDAGQWRWHDHEPLPEFSFALARAIHLYLGRSSAGLVLVQLEDLIGMTDPINVPGTHLEHANWQRKLTLDSTTIFASEEIAESLRALTAVRRENGPSV